LNSNIFNSRLKSSNRNGHLYFRKVDARDSTVLDLFTDDVQIFFPKFGLAHSKAALVKLSEIMTNHLESIEHDIEAFNYIVSGDRVVATARKPEVLQDLIEKYPLAAWAVKLDVTDLEDARSAIRGAVK
jgi:hypothetical protein